MKLILLISLLAISASIYSQNQSLGVFTHSADIGKPKLPGSSSFDPVTKTYNLKGAGYNIWFNRDEFHYLYNKMKGDFRLTANFQFASDLVIQILPNFFIAILYSLSMYGKMFSSIKNEFKHAENSSNTF